MLDAIMNDLLGRALLAGAGVGLLAGTQGSFVIWRRMAYLGDAMGHAALLGVVAGLLLNISSILSVMVTALLIAALLALMERDKRLPFDALLVVTATGALSAGLALYGQLPDRPVDVMAYLFGDILAVSKLQMEIIYGLAIGQILMIWRFWPSLMRIVLHESVAIVENIAVRRLQFGMMLLIAATVAIAMQVVGVLLMTAMLVIPAVTSRLLASSPLQMVVGSVVFAVIAALGGVQMSWEWNISTGPAIVLTAVSLFIVAKLVSALLKIRN